MKTANRKVWKKLYTEYRKMYGKGIKIFVEDTTGGNVYKVFRGSQQMAYGITQQNWRQ